MKNTEQKQGKSVPSAESEMDCRDNVRFTLSDEAGTLKFKSFEIVNMPQCSARAEGLREYLLSRPLCDVDLNAVRSMRCPHGKEGCVEIIARIIDEHKELFG